MKFAGLVFLMALLCYVAQAKYVCHCSSKTNVSLHSNALTKKSYNYVHTKVLNCPGDKFQSSNIIMDGISTYDTDGKACAQAFMKACTSYGAKRGWCANL
ncbi:uncharacterized protein BYT42DRAFT_567376 [Radiomyces spectabilis]|uniref:uncharacterized protein n=1 Tax=Radiomyces spectabilis TaxID=64574 RepID=UPI00221FD068|nr:uncharacterized protein BYT42DRAFT_567376 [Radiomyces spectabilis]KAI8379079.1 hypothetical protein BYT42DRAFT_567376 [Radiomyces spectabilis]